MSTNKSRRPDLESLATQIVPFPEPYRSLVFREVTNGSEESAVAAVEAAGRAEFAERLLTAIPVPPEIGNAADRTAAYRAHVERAALDVHESKTSLPRPDDEFPELMAGPLARAGTAEKALAKAEEKRHALDEQATRDREVEALKEQSAPKDIAALERRARWRTFFLAVLFVSEYGVACRNWAGISGLLDEHAAPTVREWAMTLLLGASTAIAGFGFGHFIWHSIKRTSAASRVAGVAQFSLPALGLLFAIGQAIIRFAGDLSADQMTGGVQTATAVATGVVSFVLLVVIPFVTAMVFDERQRLIAEIDDARAADAFTRDAVSSRTEAIGAIERDIATCKADIEAPAKIRETYALGVNAVLRRLSERDEHLKRLTLEARSVFRLLSAASPAMRDAVRTLLSGLREIEDNDDTKTRRARATGAATLVAVIVAAAVSSTGCPSAPSVRVTPQLWTTVCDGTGVVGATCTSGFLAEAFVAFANEARTPGSVFMVIATNGSFAETKVTLRIEVPRTARRQRGSYEAWIREEVARFSSLDIPADGEKRTVNQSDEFAAIAVAEREAESVLGFRRKLIISGDGWSIGSGVNFEKRIGSIKDVKTALARSRVLPTDSAFDETLFCGLHHEGHSAALVAARDAIWLEFLPKATFRTTCANMFPPVPKGWLKNIPNSQSKE